MVEVNGARKAQVGDTLRYKPPGDTHPRTYEVVAVADAGLYLQAGKRRVFMRFENMRGYHVVQ